MRSDWEIVKQYSTDDESIVFIRDLNLGRMSVTNDAEAVFLECQKQRGPCRVVYEDSEGELCEITYANFAAFFKPWHGLVWDKLTKV